MSGWSTTTVELRKTRTAEAFLEELEEKVLGERDYAGVESERVVVVCRWGYEMMETLPQWLEERTEWWGQAVVINANDTTDSGEGHLHKTKKSDVIKVETKDGYEGAAAHDVAGYFDEKLGFRPRVRF